MKNAMQLELQLVLELRSVFSCSVKASHVLQTASQSFTVKVQLELFLVSPNRQERKGAELHLVTAENCSLFVTQWKNSKLFDFGSLYQEEGTILVLYKKEKSLKVKKDVGWRAKKYTNKEG